jgi:hypothetical protein
MQIRLIWTLTFFANFARGFIFRPVPYNQQPYKKISPSPIPANTTTTTILLPDQNTYSTSYKDHKTDQNIIDNLIKIIGDINDLPKDEKKTLKMRIWKSSDLKKLLNKIKNSDRKNLSKKDSDELDNLIKKFIKTPECKKLQEKILIFLDQNPDLFTLSQDDNIGTLPNDVRAQDQIDKKKQILGIKLLTVSQEISQQKFEMYKLEIPKQILNLSFIYAVFAGWEYIMPCIASIFLISWINQDNYSKLKNNLETCKKQEDEINSDIKVFENHERNQKLFNKLVNDSKGNIKELLNSVGK